jgi:hypothetical protein
MVHCRPFFKMHQNFQLVLYSIALRPDSCPHVFLVSVCMVVFCHWTWTNFKRFKSVSAVRYSLKVFSIFFRFGLKAYVELERFKIIEQEEHRATILLWMNDGHISRRHHQVLSFVSILIFFSLFQTALQYHQWRHCL